MVTTRSQTAANRGAEPIADRETEPAAQMAAARNPNEAVAGPFNYMDKTHWSMYKDNTQSLYDDKETKRFDLEPEHLQTFMALFGSRAKRCNWKSLLTYTPPGGLPIYMVEHYGTVTEAQVRAKALAYLPQQGRLSQDSEQIYQCLLKSVTVEAFNRLSNLSERYNVNVTINGAQEELTDGPLLLAVIVSLSYTNTRAMGTIYRDQLSKLNEKMQEIEGSNIQVFNAHAKQLRNLLAAGGGTCDDMQHYLIKAYKQTGDQEFTTYIRQKELAWKDGLINWDNLGTDLMALAENYYRDAVNNKIWMQSSVDQTRIIALEAQLRDASVTVKALQSAMVSGSYRKTKDDRFKPRKGDRDRGGKEPRPLRDRPAGIECARIDRPNQGNTHEKTVYGGHHIRGPFLKYGLSGSAAIDLSEGNSGSEGELRAVCIVIRRVDPALPC